MPARRKKAKKRIKKLEKQLRLVTQEAKKLEANIQDLAKELKQGPFRTL